MASKTAAKKPKVKKLAPTGIVLPKGYLSWSQLDLWERNPEQYKKQYFLGEKSFENDAMRYGTHISNMFEGKEKPLDHVEQSLLLLAQKFGNPEREVRVTLESSYGNIYLYGKIDDMEETVGGQFLERKTGVGKWSQKKANNHGQVHMYFLMVKLEKGTQPRQAILEYLPTEEIIGINQYHRRVTGEIVPIIVEWNIGDEIEIRRRIENAAREISTAFRAFTKNQEEKNG